MGPSNLVVIVAIAFVLNVQNADGWDYWGWGYGLGAAAIAAPVVAAPYALYAAPHGVPLCLFLKLLAVKTGLLVATPSIAIGSLVAGAGTGLLAGKLGTLALLKAKQSSHVLHSHGWGGWSATHKIPLLPFHKWRLEYKHHGNYPWKSWKHGQGHGGHSWKIAPNPGWGWPNSHEPFFRHYDNRHAHDFQDYGYTATTSYSQFPPIYEHYGHSHNGNGDEVEWSESRPAEKVIKPRSVNLEEEPKPIEPLTNFEYLSRVMKFAAPVSDLFSGLSGILGRKARSTRQIDQTPEGGKNPSEFPGLNAKESEKFLEQYFDGLSSTNPEEGRSLIRVLREAYFQVIQDLGGKSDTVPEFKPMPDLNKTKTTTTTTQEPATAEEESEPDLQKIIDQIPEEVETYFSMLSAFDNETCFQKLICDIHTRVKEEDELNFTPYERNVLAVFALLKELPKDKIHDPTSTKYLNAAKYGEEHLSSAFCHQLYPDCQYSTNQIIDMGSELDQASAISVPNHKLNDLEQVMDVPRV